MQILEKARILFEIADENPPHKNGRSHVRYLSGQRIPRKSTAD